MKTPNLIILPEKIVISTIREAIQVEMQHFNDERKKAEGEKIYTINAVARKLGLNFATVKKYCNQGHIRTVPGGKIPESAILEFLNNSKKL
ncbi:MAG: helix-turn-helix domain-containing protein [Bacteroidetes bacterium]|nr:helix-turn-helix domain-containing protein [Bacteroidota bacterium]